MTPEIQTTTPATGGADNGDPLLADVPTIFDEGTFVLVGCGAAKRDPDDPVDVHEAVVGPDESFGQDWTDETGPAWRAEDLYTSTYFGVKRDFAKMATQWARQRDGWAWSILSAEHHLLAPWEPVKPYDTTIDDLGDDYTNDDHLADLSYERRPDGKALVTELDEWVTMVAIALQRWVTMFDDAGASPHGSGTLRNLIVLAGRDYVEPLRERGAFDGLGNLRDGHYGIGVEPTFLFEEIDAGGIGEQMAWMSDAMSQVEERRADTEQVEVGQWTGETRSCDVCEATADEADLVGVNGGVYCGTHQPEACAGCGDLTRETGHGTYPLCPDCQSERGGMRDNLGPDHEQAGIVESVAATDGGEQK